MIYKLRLLKLNCYRQNEADGDEIFIKYQNKRVWPLNSKYQKLNEGSAKLNLDISGIEKESMVTLELWDYDLFTPNDMLGTFSMLVNERGGPFTTDLKRDMGTDDSKYSIEWEVS
ncbi:hypothetical protein C900_05062 [Fulvivirga imtechensis AK7]|uniref:C2 domain-containing protein n=1 Tax=Fulvivirga imtechensis AK7 TaxID=1237149 RepID=L8JPS4_9BACT|nr:hypothetical protein [Fulvivirga imtechensis]ELR69372.1 hypothetical protein C900_05062 [Fulvivirga imtechensis AK7]